MLKNVVDYLNYKETARSNLAREAETKRHNTVGERFSYDQLAESARHNVSTEKETQRHNLVGERLSTSELDEKVRHNKVEETQAWSNLSQMKTLREAQTSAANAQAKASSASATLSSAKAQTEDRVRPHTVGRAESDARVSKLNADNYYWNNIGAGIASSAIGIIPGLAKLFK